MKQTRIEILARLLKADQITSEEFVALAEVEIRYYNPYSPVNPPSQTPYTNPYWYGPSTTIGGTGTGIGGWGITGTTITTNPVSAGFYKIDYNEFI